MQSNHIVVPFGQEHLVNCLNQFGGGPVVLQQYTVLQGYNGPISISSMSNQGLQGPDANGKNKDSDTNVFIDRTYISPSINTEQALEAEIKKAYEDMRNENNRYPPSTRDFPKVTFPKKLDEKVGGKKYLFVDFETEDQNLGKIISRAFIDRFNKIHGKIAECAREKDQEDNNLYFEPLPYNTTKDELRDTILAALNIPSMHHQDVSQPWSVYVKKTDESKYPVGFCRIPNGQYIVEIIRKMNKKTWEELNIGRTDPNNRTTRLTVKKANRTAKAVDQRLPQIACPQSQITFAYNPSPANNLQFQPQLPSTAQPITGMPLSNMPSLPQTPMSTSYEPMSNQIKYETSPTGSSMGALMGTPMSPYPEAQTPYNHPLWPAAPRNTMHNPDHSYQRQTLQEPCSPQPLLTSSAFSFPHYH